MDTLSTSVSSLSHLYAPPSAAFHSHRQRSAATSTGHNFPRSTSIISHNPTSSSSHSFAHKNPNFQHTVTFSYVKPSKSLQTHKNAATGYAAALVSVCQSKNCLWRTQEDVEGLLKFLDDWFLEGEEKVEIAKEVVGRGKFGKYLKGLVNMLIEKGSLGILGDVLEEFERISYELVKVV